LDLIASAPRAGDGVHAWIYKVARQLHVHRSEEDIFCLLKAALVDCGRLVPDKEIWDAVRNAKATAWQRRAPGEPVVVSRPAWPERDKAKIDEIVRQGFGWWDLCEKSPVRFDDGGIHTEEIIDALFPGNPLLCCGSQKVLSPDRLTYEFDTKSREDWRGRLSSLPLIVPSPMIRIEGKTKAGKPSPHTLDNTGPRRFLVIEFDFSVKARDGVTDSEWATLVRGWSDASISVADACAALLAHLAERGPMALAVHSGGKSVHGWFACQQQTEEALRRYMNYAHTLGADHATWTRSQFVRMPDGMRETLARGARFGKRQSVYFFNPSAIL
jgi:hypothetical protein